MGLRDEDLLCSTAHGVRGVCAPGSPRFGACPNPPRHRAPGHARGAGRSLIDSLVPETLEFPLWCILHPGARAVTCKLVSLPCIRPAVRALEKAEVPAPP